MNLSMNEADRVGYFLNDLQAALPMDSGWYTYTNRIDMGLVIQKGLSGPEIALYMDGTWEFKPFDSIADPPGQAVDGGN